MANPFWSRELQDRFALEQARPEDLSLVPEGGSGVSGVGESEEMIPDAQDLLDLLSLDVDQENLEEEIDIQPGWPEVKDDSGARSSAGPEGGERTMALRLRERRPCGDHRVLGQQPEKHQRLDQVNVIT